MGLRFDHGSILRFAAVPVTRQLARGDPGEYGSGMTKTRCVIQEDAVAWLAAHPARAGASFVTSMPDFSEFPKLTRPEWARWFQNTAALVLRACPPEGAAIFYQRDVKAETGWVDKAFLIQKAAEAESVPQLWHKIVARVPVGNVAYGKPGYSHLLCFSRGVKLAHGESTADILADAGEPSWPRGMGRKVAEHVCDFILARTSTREVVAPFCGEGLILQVANERGLDALGIERSLKRAEKAMGLQL